MIVNNLDKDGGSAMYELQIDDTVRFEGKGKVQYGLVKSIGKKFAVVYNIGNCETRKIALSRLTFVPPVTLSPEQLSMLCRYQISWTALTGGAPDVVQVNISEPYTLTLRDLLDGLQSIRKAAPDNAVLYDEWFDPLYSRYCIYLEDFLEEKTPEDVVTLPGLPNRASKVAGILRVIENLFSKSVPVRNAASSLIREINGYFIDEGKPISERTYNDKEKEDFLLYYDKEKGKGNISNADEETLSLYRSFLDDLCAKENKYAMKTKGLCCIHGDNGFERDLAEAHRLFLRLFELTADPHYAMYLGDMCYSGEYADGMPQYEEAFRYYCIAAGGGINRANIYVADMFAYGRGAPKNPDIAWRLLENVYSRIEERFLAGDYCCNFAETAFYRSKCIRSDNYGCHDASLAYESLLKAGLAVQKRMPAGIEGDQELASKIKEATDELISMGLVPDHSKSAEIRVNTLFKLYLHKYRRMIMRIRKLKNGELKITYSLEKLPEDKDQPMMFIFEPKTGFCDMVSSVSVKVTGSTLENVPEESVYFNSTDGRNYFIGGTKVISIDGEYIFSR